MGAYTKLLSIIVPCYNEEESVPLFYQEAIKQETFFHEKDVELELIFVDDGSKDKTVEEVKKLRERMRESIWCLFQKLRKRSCNHSRA